jgi:hypothetical protein
VSDDFKTDGPRGAKEGPGLSFARSWRASSSNGLLSRSLIPATQRQRCIASHQTNESTDANEGSAMDTENEDRRSVTGSKPRRQIRSPWSRTRIARVLVAGTAGLWLVGVGYGFSRLRNFESTPGMVGLTPSFWPSDSAILPRTGRSTLVMSVHPQCSCTEASLSELSSIMNLASVGVSAYVLFISPTGMEPGWEKTGTWSQAKAIPGVTVLLDRKETESTRFGALTSGYVVLYDPTGRLIFSGGITAMRGHAGENVGRDTVVDLIEGRTAKHHVHEVFGCPLTDSPAQVAQR